MSPAAAQPEPASAATAVRSAPSVRLVAAIETADELLQRRDALSRSVMELLAAADEERAITRHLHDVLRFTQVSVTQERTVFDAEVRRRAFPRVDAEQRTTVE